MATGAVIRKSMMKSHCQPEANQRDKYRPDGETDL